MDDLDLFFQGHLFNCQYFGFFVLTLSHDIACAMLVSVGSMDWHNDLDLGSDLDLFKVIHFLSSPILLIQ